MVPSSSLSSFLNHSKKLYSRDTNSTSTKQQFIEDMRKPEEEKNKKPAQYLTKEKCTPYQLFVSSKDKNGSPEMELPYKYFGLPTHYCVKMINQKPIPYQGGTFQGDWDGVQNKPLGQGALRIQKGPNCFIYEGLWNEDGTVTLPDGTTHQGPEWKDWEVPDGYEGDITNGKRGGFGKMKYENSTYTGPWKDDQMHGTEGKIEWKNGCFYKGGFKEDKRHGLGTQTELDGSKFVGYWRDNQKHGIGLSRDEHGLQTKQIWAYGHFDSGEDLTPKEAEALLETLQGSQELK